MPNPLTSNFKAQFRQDLNDELLDLAGITITLHSLNEGSVTKDVLYGETSGNTGWNYTAHADVKCFLANYDVNWETREEGLTDTAEGEVRFSKGWLSDNSVHNPKIGDIVQSTFGYFDINRTHRDGWISDGADSWTYLTCEIQKTSKFTPDNKVS